MVTKRDLVDLRESIQNTIRSIKHPINMHGVMQIEEGNRAQNHNQSAPQFNNPAMPLLYLPSNSNINFCQLCLSEF